MAQEVQDNIDAINARIVQLEETAAQYVSALQQTMEHHNHVIQLIKTYNNKATDLMFAAGDLEEELQQPTLYQSVAEVQAAIEHLNASSRQVGIIIFYDVVVGVVVGPGGDGALFLGLRRFWACVL